MVTGIIVYIGVYMKKTKHKPPSRIKYEENNPVFSTRMPKEWHDKLNQLLKDTGQSRKDFMGISLKKQYAKYETLKEKNFDEGFDKAYNIYAIWYFCSFCNKLIHIFSNSDEHKAIIKYMNEHGWGHKNCKR